MQTTTTRHICLCCGHENKLDLRVCVNEDQNTEMVQSLLDGKLFNHKCEKCGCTINVDHQSMYVDLANKTLVCYVCSIMEIAEIQHLIDEKTELHCLDRNRIRITDTQNAFREKVHLWKAGLDDRIVEIVKFFVLRTLKNRDNTRRVDEILCWVGPDNQLYFDVLGEQSGSTHLPMSFYHEIEERFGEVLDAMETPPVEINTDWAIEFLEQYG